MLLLIKGSPSYSGNSPAAAAVAASLGHGPLCLLLLHCLVHLYALATAAAVTAAAAELGAVSLSVSWGCMLRWTQQHARP